MNDEMKWDLESLTRQALDDPRTTHEFIALALTEPDEDVAWDAVSTLHLRGTREVFDAACELCASECPQERKLGGDILGQLGVPDRTFPEESVGVLLGLLEVENDENVLCAICIAFGHIHHPATVSWLARLSTHRSADVRYAVAYGLEGFEDELAIRTLIVLSRDSDTDVRDWATFALGSQIDLDTPEIRAALLARIVDEDEMTRGEALVGLARRKDHRVIKPLIKELERHADAEYGEYAVDAAKELADARLLPILRKLKQSATTDVSELDEAIRSCEGAGPGTMKT